MNFSTPMSVRPRAFALATPLIAAMLLGLSACSDNAADPADPNGTSQTAQPVAAAIVDGKPRGLYFMTRFWTATNSLEKAAWYFAADGQVYRDLRHGFSAADLAAHDGLKGTLSISGDKLKITYSNGTTDEGVLTDDGTAFTWIGGIFKPVTSFSSSTQIVGNYVGGESLSFPNGGAVSTQSLQLNADGSFRWTNVGFAGGGDISWGMGDATTGQWSLSGYSLTMTNAAGVSVRGIVFPYDIDSDPATRNWVFLSGIMFKPE